MADKPPPLERTESARARPTRRGLQKFDTSAFTLQQHCGSAAAAVRDCLRAINLPANYVIDTTELEADGWAAAPQCKPLWEAYRQCGQAFMNATDDASIKCAAELTAFRKCSPTRDGVDRCHELEQALFRCSASKVKVSMSGQKLPDE